MATLQNGLVYFGPSSSLTQMREERDDLIQQRAYFKALRRHFAPGQELEDWLAAEEEVDNWLSLLQGD